MIEIFDLLKSYLSKYYESFFKEKKPVAYLSAMAPQELFRAYGYNIFLPENHSAFLGSKRKAQQYIKRAIQEGFSPEICSYLLSDIGSHLERKCAFENYGLNDFPKPDIICYSTNQCYEIGEWFKFLGKLYKVPVLSIPAVKNFNDEKEFLDFYEKNLIETIKKIENIRGKKLKEAKLIDALEYTKMASKKWKAFLNLNLMNDYKYSFLDHLFLMAPMVLGRGRFDTYKFYEKLYQIGLKTKNKEYKYRIWWEGMPVWGKLKYFKERFEELKIAPVGSTYASSWIFSFKKIEPIKNLAKIYYEDLFIAWSEEKKKEWLKKKAKEFKIDGFIFMEAKTCWVNTNTHFGMASKIYKEIGVPSLILYGDMVDLSHFSEAETNLKLEAFLETIKKN